MLCWMSVDSRVLVKTDATGSLDTMLTPSLNPVMERQGLDLLNPILSHSYKAKTILLLNETVL